MQQDNKISFAMKASDDDVSRFERANDLRDMADKLEMGSIKAVVALCITTENDIDMMSTFRSRVELIGAMDYAKTEISIGKSA